MSQQYDEHIMSKQADPASTPKSAAAQLFDLRVLIGGLFTFYGVVLIIAGLFASAVEIQKASGININLWMGIVMLIVGLLFLLWWRLNPVQRPVDPAHNVEPAAEYTETETPARENTNPF